MKHLMLWLSLSLLVLAENYTLGRGVTLYQTEQFNITAGGHFSADVQSVNPDNDTAQNSIGIENMALMLYGSYSDMLSFLVEYGNEDLYRYTNNEGDSQSPEFRRFYVEAHLNDVLNLKLGRFLTPIGIYNPTYINALRWSNIRPLVAQEVFPDIITGAQLHGLVGEHFEYAIFTQLEDDETSSISSVPISEFTGAELRYLFGVNSRVAINYGHYKSDTVREICTFGGVNTLVPLGENEFTAEALYKDGTWTTGGGETTRWNDFSWYAQYVQNIREKHYATLRLGQKIRDGFGVGSWNESNGVLGYVYRPSTALSYKLEYRHFQRTGQGAYITDDFHLSFSVLF